MRRSERHQNENIGKSSCVAAAVTTVLGLFAGAAQAQILDRFVSPDISGLTDEAGVTVISRRRPDYESTGIRAGNFVIRPQLTERVGYESNVLGANSASGSALIQSSAGVDVTSTLSRVNVNAALSVDDFRYPDQDAVSHTNWAARIGASYDIGQDTVTAGYDHLNLNQTPQDLNTPQQLAQALSFRIDTVRVAYRANFARTFVTPAFAFSNYDYSSGTIGGTIYDQSYRNRVLFTPSVTAGYQLAERRNVIVIVRNAIANFSNRPLGLPKRDYNDFAILGGIDYDVTGLFRIRALGGYEIRTFSAGAYDTIQAPIAELSAIWNPTGLTTLTGTVSRRIQDAADETTAGYTETSGALTVDHELLRNVLLQANAGVFYNEYKGGGNQTLYSVGTGASYLLNRNISVSASYDYTARTSGGGNNNVVFSNGFSRFGSSYDDHRVLLGVRLSL